jgi:hypothetical protein
MEGADEHTSTAVLGMRPEHGKRVPVRSVRKSDERLGDGGVKGRH